MKQFVEITCRQGSNDASLFETVVNVGIDSHLEAFTKSKFSFKDTAVGLRLVCQFHISELPLLVRRLTELSAELSEQDGDESQYEAIDAWAYDIQELPEYPKDESL